MSEQRFRLDEEDRLCIHYDNEILAYVGFSEIEAEKIVEKLNEQQATIQQLEEQIHLLNNSVERMIEKFNKIYKLSGSERSI